MKSHMKRRSFLALALALTSTFAHAQSADSKPEALFANGTGGYHTFRIPSLITTKGGAVLAFAEARKSGGGDSGDIDLVMRRSTDAGKTWGPLAVVWDDAANTCGNPCPVVDEKDGRIHLLLTWNSGTEHEKAIRARTAAQGRRVFYSVSSDDGVQWSKPVDISAQADKEDWGWYATGPGRGIQLTRGEHRGRLVIPANHSRADSKYDAHALLSDDAGKTWRISTSLGTGANESTVAELTDGTLLYNARMQTDGKGLRAIAHSKDGGATWSPLEHDAALPCPVCEGSLLRYAFADEPHGGGKSVLLFCNPVGPGRSNITLKASFDEGKTWPHALPIHAPKGPGYTALTRLPDHRIGVVFEFAGGIQFTTHSLAEVVGRK